MFTIITPADDLHLLTDIERRRAAGLADDDDSRDAELAELSLEAAEWIATLCGVSAADGLPPTLLRERLLETIECSGSRSTLPLARRFVWISDTDAAPFVLTDNDTVIDAADYLVNTTMGRITRLQAGRPIWWGWSTLTIEYTAGLDPDNIPQAVKSVARDYLRMAQTRADSDPLEQSVRVEGLDLVTYRAASDAETLFKASAAERLVRYMAAVQI